jgi:hypothetical protein
MGLQRGVKRFGPGRNAEEERGRRNSPRGGVRKRKAGGGTRPETEFGRGARSEWGDSARGEGRKRNPGGGTRPEAECGGGIGKAGLEASGTTCGEWHPDPRRNANPHSPTGVTISRLASCPASPFHFRTPPRFKSPHSLLAPHPGFLFRTPPRVEFRLPHSSSALRLGSKSLHSPLPRSAPLRSTAALPRRTRGTSPVRSPRDRQPGYPASAPPPPTAP